MYKNNIYRKRPFDFLLSAIFPGLFTAFIVAMIIFGLANTQVATQNQALRTLEDSIRRAVVVAYAIDGRYPESIEYIEKNFGIHIDRNTFIVHYTIFATNVFPDITVIAR